MHTFPHSGCYLVVTASNTALLARFLPQQPLPHPTYQLPKQHNQFILRKSPPEHRSYLQQPQTQPQPMPTPLYYHQVPENRAPRRFRRRYNQIDRIFPCTFPGCAKSYGLLNHLNTHIKKKGHGTCKSKAEFQPAFFSSNYPIRSAVGMHQGVSSNTSLYTSTYPRIQIAGHDPGRHQDAFDAMETKPAEDMSSAGPSWWLESQRPKQRSENGQQYVQESPQEPATRVHNPPDLHYASNGFQAYSQVGGAPRGYPRHQPLFGIHHSRREL